MMKSLEAIGLGVVIEREDTLWDNGEFLEKTLSDLRREKILYEPIVDIVREAPSVEILEITSIAKLGGASFHIWQGGGSQTAQGNNH